MAEEVVVKELLTPDMVNGGKKLAQVLSQGRLDLTCALWLYMPEASRWRFVISSPNTVSEGPLKVYELIQESLATLAAELGKNSNLEIENISVMSPETPLIKAITSSIRTGGVADIRIKRSRFKGVSIDEAYVCFIKDTNPT